MMDIYQILKQEHDEVQDMLDQQIEGKKSGKAQDLKEIQQQLSIHLSGEEKLLYPLLTKSEESKEDAFEAFEEHHVAKVTLNELMKMSPGDERWLAKLKVLKELIDHHVEEEERNLFKVAKKVISNEQAKEIGQKYQQEKEKQLGKSK
jgi:hemerythrin-like domain-containing protein